MAENIKSFGHLELLPVDKIIASSNQPRKNFEEAGIVSLAKNIKEIGLLQPISVTKKSGGFYQLVAGERRLRAFRFLKKKEIPAIIFEYFSSSVGLAENMKRKQLASVEIADAIKDLFVQRIGNENDLAKKVSLAKWRCVNNSVLTEEDKSILAVCSEVGILPHTAEILLEIAYADEDVKNMILHNKLTMEKAVLLIGSPKEQREEALLLLIDGRINHDKAKWLLKCRDGTLENNKEGELRFDESPFKKLMAKPHLRTLKDDVYFLTRNLVRLTLSAQHIQSIPKEDFEGKDAIKLFSIIFYGGMIEKIDENKIRENLIKLKKALSDLESKFPNSLHNEKTFKIGRPNLYPDEIENEIFEKYFSGISVKQIMKDMEGKTYKIHRNTIYGIVHRRALIKSGRMIVLPNELDKLDKNSIYNDFIGGLNPSKIAKKYSRPDLIVKSADVLRIIRNKLGKKEVNVHGES